VGEIGGHSELTDTETISVKLAALFHDVGYTQVYTGHEEVSMEIAKDFLSERDVEEEIIQMVCGCISATRFPQFPKDGLGMIICDADFYHFSLPDYELYAERLRKEWSENLGKQYTDKEWNSLNLKLLTDHHYFTDYSRSDLEKRKHHNIITLSDELLEGD